MLPHSIRSVAGELRRRRRSQWAIVIGNGPTAGEDLARVSERYPKADLFSVNMFPSSGLFTQYRPSFHLYVDTEWWSGRLPVCVESLADLNRRVDWPMTVLALSAGEAYLRGALPNRHVSILPYGAVAHVGLSPAMSSVLYGALLMMPVGQTVLLHAAYWPLVMGYERVVLVGAGHEYLQYEVDQHTNALTWLDSHFYGTPKHVRTYDGMAGEVSAWAECFVQWRLLAQFARARGVVFRNATGFSMIDSIDREWGEE